MPKLKKPTKVVMADKEGNKKVFICPQFRSGYLSGLYDEDDEDGKWWQPKQATWSVNLCDFISRFHSYLIGIIARLGNY